jgi:hypothetical protein
MERAAAPITLKVQRLCDLRAEVCDKPMEIAPAFADERMRADVDGIRLNVVNKKVERLGLVEQVDSLEEFGKTRIRIAPHNFRPRNFVCVPINHDFKHSHRIWKSSRDAGRPQLLSPDMNYDK